MNNDQLAAARRVMSEFPTLRIRKSGWKLTPVAPGGATGTTIEVIDTMSPTVLSSRLREACEGIA